ncbi:MAG: TetR/AcrR family transcriptional regulator [Candidatus Pelagadaptatus aseana]|uniref:TetR/AcrR family transcriptional regulator n=1 Tax=Candidatus Pelagadaptatus aseana TaxID=3120508 RepID=UPI0039B23C17
MQQVRMKNRKQQIVTLGLELLQTRGFDSFSYQDLSRELGITKASIHHHFPKKEDLGLALCDAIHQWHEREYDKVRALDASTLEKLDYYINVSLRKACGMDKVCPLSSLQGNLATLPDSMRAAIRTLDQEEIKFVAELLQQGRDSGELKFTGSVHGQALVCLLTFKGAFQYARSHGLDLYHEATRQLNCLLLG